MLCLVLIYRATHSTDQIIAIDALCVEYSYQFQEEAMLREINKAVAGFQLCLDNKEGIASGKWGCGVFGGDPYLKSILQWIAASLVGKPVFIHDIFFHCRLFLLHLVIKNWKVS